MNRAQRRALAKGKLQKEHVVPLPKALDEFTIFSPLDNLLMQMATGSINVNKDDKPVFYGPSGQWVEVIPCLQGWVFTWRKISADLDLKPFDALISALISEQLITNAMLIQAQTALVALKKYFRTHDRAEIQSRAKTAQIAIFMGTDNV